MKEVYSLWLCPEGEVMAKYRTLNKSISPIAFEPHITLVPDYPGNLEDIKTRLARSLSSIKTPIKLHLNGPQVGDSYYRCLYDLAEKSPALDDVFSAVRKEFGGQPDYYPHMSIAYGDLDTGIKQDMAIKTTELKKKLQIPESFTVRAVTVFFTGQYVEEGDRMASWHIAATVPFGK